MSTDITCPVCEWRGSRRPNCPQCGWQLEGELHIGAATPAQHEQYERELQNARRNWQQQQRIEALQAQLATAQQEREQLQQRLSQAEQQHQDQLAQMETERTQLLQRITTLEQRPPPTPATPVNTPDASTAQAATPEPRLLQDHTGVVRCVAFSPDGRLLASGGNDTTLRVWDVASGQLIRAFLYHTQAIYTVAFSPDGRMLATGGADRIISLWELTNDVPIGQLGAHLGDGYGTPGTITSLVFSPDEQLFAASYHTAPDSVWIWSRYQYQITYRIPHHASVEDIHFSPDGQLLASGCADGVARIWQATSGQLVCELYGHTRPITSVAFDKSGQFFATGSADHTINLRNVSNWHEVRQIAGRAHMVFDVAFSPDGRWLVSGGGSVVHVWDVERGKEIHRLPHPCSIYAVAFSPDGKLLATACHDGIVRLWPIAA